MNYDLQTLTAIIQEARKQGHQDDFIAAQLGISLDDDAFFTFNKNERRLGLELSGIAEGFHEWELAHLHEDDKRKILIIAARIAEATYRRGLQQGFWAASTKQKLKIHPDKLRFGNEPLDSARMPLCGTKMSSIERLRIQHGSALAALGLDCILDDLQ